VVEIVWERAAGNWKHYGNHGKRNSLELNGMLILSLWNGGNRAVLTH